MALRSRSPLSLTVGPASNRSNPSIHFTACNNYLSLLRLEVCTLVTRVAVTYLPTFTLLLQSFIFIRRDWKQLLPISICVLGF